MAINNDNTEPTPGKLMHTGFYEKERFRQSRTNSNVGRSLTLVGAVGRSLTLVGAVIFFANPLLLLSGNISVAEAEAVGKLAFVAFESGRKLSKDANDRLDKANAVSEDEESE